MSVSIFLEQNRQWAAEQVEADPEFFSRHTRGQKPRLRAARSSALDLAQAKVKDLKNKLRAVDWCEFLHRIGPPRHRGTRWTPNPRRASPKEASKATSSGGEPFDVPKGVRHYSIAEQECLVLLVEREATLNTGKLVTDKARSIDEQLKRA